MRIRYGFVLLILGAVGYFVWAIGLSTTITAIEGLYAYAHDTVRYWRAPPVTTKAPHANPRAFLAVTVDDGSNTVLNATPILEQYGIRSTQFIITCVPDTHTYSNMSWSQIKTLHARGHEIGSHSCSHINLMTERNRDRVWQEINGSRATLAEKLNVPVPTIESFAAPNGEYGPNEIELIQKAGYAYAVTGWGEGPNFDQINPHVLKRIDIRDDREPKGICQLIEQTIAAGNSIGEPALIILVFHFFVDDETQESNTLYLHIGKFRKIVECAAKKRDDGELFVGTLSQAVKAYEEVRSQTSNSER